jgi:hypothetical protein
MAIVLTSVLVLWGLRGRAAGAVEAEGLRVAAVVGD